MGGADVEVCFRFLGSSLAIDDLVGSCWDFRWWWVVAGGRTRVPFPDNELLEMGVALGSVTGGETCGVRVVDGNSPLASVNDSPRNENVSP